MGQRRNEWHYQHVKKIRIDCDEDTILLEVEQEVLHVIQGIILAFIEMKMEMCIDE